MANLYSQFTYDDALNLKDAGLVAATAAESTIIDLGSGVTDGYLVIDVSAVETASTDETYDIRLEGSNVSGMGSGSVTLACAPQMGNAAAPADADTSTGRFVVPFRNEQNGTVYRYVRLHTTVAGAIATGINYSAFIAKRS